MSARTPKSARADKSLPPTLPRVQLDTLIRIRREMTVCYREAKFGHRDVTDVYKLVSVLSMIAKLLTEHEFEQRLEALEKASAQGGPQS